VPQEPFASSPDSRPASQDGPTQDRVYADERALSELQMLVVEGMQEGPGQPMEVGGLLFGIDGRDVRIQGVEPLPIEHRFGPSFWLCSSDIEVVKWKIESAPATVVGHFRSRKVNVPEIEDVDHVIADLLRIQEPILLLISVLEGRPPAWLIYRRKLGNWVELSKGPPPQFVVPASHSVPAQILAGAAGVPAPDGRRWRVGVSLALAVTALLLLTYFALWRRAVPAGSGAVGEIGLAAQPGPGGVRLTWNHASSVIEQSTEGILTIRDGDSSRELRMGQDQLRHGTVVYVPRSSQVEFRLQVYRDPVHVSVESVSVATGLPSSSNQLASVGEAPSASPLRWAAPIQVNVPTNRPQPSMATSPGTRRTHTARAQNPPAVPLVQPSPAAQVPVIPTPPQVSTLQPDKVPEILATLSAPAPPSIPLSNGPPRGTEPTVSFIAAVPVHKASPAVPSNLRSVVENSVSVDVKVVIDATGKVVSAVPAEANMPAQKMLAPQAVQAALLWRFQPARKNGQPVRSESLLKFAFERR